MIIILKTHPPYLTFALLPQFFIGAALSLHPSEWLYNTPFPEQVGLDAAPLPITNLLIFNVSNSFP